MKLLSKISALSVLLTLGFIYACHKDTKVTNNAPLTVVNTASFEDLKAYAYFKIGTYWVYEDSLHPGNFDSVYVTQNGIKYDTIKQANGGIPPGIYPYFGVETVDSRNNTRDYTCYSEQAYFGQNHGLINVQISWNAPSEYEGEFYFMFNRFVSGFLQSKYGPDSCTFKKQLDSMKINGVNFKNIVEFNNTVDIGQFSPRWSRVNYYISKNFGVIKRVEIDSNRIWNLKKYYIVQ